MLTAVEAVVDEQGIVHLLEPIKLPTARKAVVTILSEDAEDSTRALTLLSEASFAKDWNRPEEDEAWSYLEAEM